VSVPISFRNIVVIHRIQYGERWEELGDERIDLNLGIFLRLGTYPSGLEEQFPLEERRACDEAGPLSVDSLRKEQIALGEVGQDGLEQFRERDHFACARGGHFSVVH
jgi:hypothetical protein